MKKIIYISLFLTCLFAQSKNIPDGQYTICCDTIGKNVNDYAYFDNTLGFITIAFRLTVPTGGEVAFEATFDGANWVRISLRGIESDTYYQITDVNDNYIGSIANCKAFRVITTVQGSADGLINGTASRVASVLEGLEFGYPPHKFGYTPVNKSKNYTTAVTGDTLWIPATGKKFIVTDLIIVVGGSTDGIITVFDNTDADGNRVFRGAIEVATNRQFVFSHAFRTPFLSDAINNILKITITTDMTVDINVHGYEVR